VIIKLLFFLFHLGQLKEDDSHANLTQAEDDDKKKDKKDTDIMAKKDKKKDKKGVQLVRDEIVFHVPSEIKKHLDDYEKYLSLNKSIPLNSDDEVMKVCYLFIEVSLSYILLFLILRKNYSSMKSLTLFSM
jgi:hypothetical protein